MTLTDGELVAARLRLGITRLARLLRQQSDMGLTPTQLSALATIERAGPLALSELADRERVAPPTITRVVAKLEDDGLVARAPDPRDRRCALVSATPRGLALVNRTRSRKDAWLAARIARLPAGEQRRLASALDAIEALIETAPDHAPDPDPAPDRDRGDDPGPASRSGRGTP